MIEQLKNLWQRRELLYYMVKFQMKAENKNKVLGFLWSFLDPLLLLITYIILVHYIFGQGGPQYPVLLFVGLLSWKWFASSLSRAVTSITSKAGIIQSVHFPLIVLQVSGIIFSFFDWVFGLVVLIPMLFFFDASLTVNFLWLPVLLLIQLIGTIGACLIAAVLGTRLADLGNIIQFVIKIWFYLSPVLYSVEDRIPAKFNTLYMLVNPFAGLMESYKNVLIFGTAPNQYIIIDTLIALIVLIVGLWYFARNENKLVKEI
jgi:lipopolysaccharide transport system permease protein